MPLNLQDLTNRFLQLNTPENPFKVTVQNNKVTATWNLVDTKWIELFGKAGMKKTYQIEVTLDESKHQTSYNETTGEVDWQAGLPHISYSSSSFSGKTISFQKETAFGIKENLQPGQLYSFDFNTERIKKPILDIIQQAGWTIKKSWLEKMLGI
jgi:hypothetical protein